VCDPHICEITFTKQHFTAEQQQLYFRVLRNSQPCSCGWPLTTWEVTNLHPSSKLQLQPLPFSRSPFLTGVERPVGSVTEKLQNSVSQNSLICCSVRWETDKHK
jgi:hypothetical protein